MLLSRVSKDEVNMSKEKNNTIVVKSICLAIIVVIICVVIWLLTHQTGDHYTISEDEADTTSMECTSTSLEDAFFVSERAQRYEHLLKFLFKDDRLDQVSYDYSSVYNSESAASGASADLHTKFFKFMDSVSLSNVELNPNFAPVKSKLKISLYWDLSKVSGVVAPVFFMTEEDYNSLNNSGRSEVKRMYEDKGFSCTVTD